MEKILNADTQKRLRQESLITESEVVYMIGDKYVAENILTKTRREVHVPVRLIEATHNKRVLKG